MRRLIVSILLFVGIIAKAQIPPNYYSTAEGLSKSQLKIALHDIIKNHVEYPYTSSITDEWDILKETDKDTINSNNVILFYTGWTVDAEQEYNNGNGWTREHVWAKSHGQFGNDLGAGADVHHIRPTDGTVNSARSNLDFDDGGTVYVDADGPTTNKKDGDSWEPRDEVKGDVARMLFYMAVRYEGDASEPDLELVDDVDTYYLNQPGKGYHGKLSTLLKWHHHDPVDEFEKNRNEVIYDFQGNRNPFIDNPEFVDLIWGTISSNSFVEKVNSLSIYPNPASDYLTINIENPDLMIIYSVLGGVFKIQFQNEDTIDISSLKPGLFVIQVYKNGKGWVGRFVKR
jgi:endonuclease I